MLERALAAWLHYLIAATQRQRMALAISDPGAAAAWRAHAGTQNASDVVRAALAQHQRLRRTPWPERLHRASIEVPRRRAQAMVSARCSRTLRRSTAVVPNNRCNAQHDAIRGALR